MTGRGGPNQASRQEARLRLTASELDDIISALTARNSVDPELYIYLVNKRRGLERGKGMQGASADLVIYDEAWPAVEDREQSRP